MHIFITGGSGFVGGHLIEDLGADHQVSAMARSDRSAAVVAERGARVVRADLATIDAADLAGVDTVVHAAAYVEEWGSHDDFWSINVEGTRRLLAAARDAGVRRFILISTNATVFENKHQLDVDEAQPYPTGARFPYATSKAEAERLVLAADGPQMRTLAVRPCFIWGPRDNSVLPALQSMAAEGRFLWLDRGQARVSTTHVSNLVDAVRLALSQGRGGEAYFIADDDEVTMKDFLTGLAGSQDITLPGRSLPGAMVRGVAVTLNAVWTTLGVSSAPPITPMTAQLMSTSMTVRTDKARRELGWAPVLGRSDGLAQLAR